MKRAEPCREPERPVARFTHGTSWAAARLRPTFSMGESAIVHGSCGVRQTVRSMWCSTPKGSNLIAQGRSRSERTLGNHRAHQQNPNGVPSLLGYNPVGVDVPFAIGIPGCARFACDPGLSDKTPSGSMAGGPTETAGCRRHMMSLTRLAIHSGRMNTECDSSCRFRDPATWPGHPRLDASQVFHHATHMHLFALSSIVSPLGDS